MAWRESWGKKILLCLGLVLVTSLFCQCTRLTKLKALDKRNLMLGRGQTKRSDLLHGRLLIGQNSPQDANLQGTKATKNLQDVDVDYQADMGWGEPKQPKGQEDGSSSLKPDNTAVERLLKMEPKVECTGDSMKLQVEDATSTPGSLFFVDRGSRLPPLPLSKLPSSCGYTFRSTRRDLVLVAPYDGCFVAHEEDSYVLPLRWLGLPVRLSCPLMKPSSPNPPMVTCHSEGMVVKTEWTISVAQIKVNLNGNWEPLMKASPRCGFSVIVHPEGIVVSVRYAPCLEKKDGMYTLGLVGDGETKISCPLLSPAQPEPTKKPVKGPEEQTKTPSKGVSTSVPSHNSASTNAPEPPKPAQSAVPQVPDENLNLGAKDIYQPQFPYPFFPNFFYPFPENPDSKPTPTVRPTAPPVIKKNDGQQSQQTVPSAKQPLNPEGQVPHPFVHLPFYPWEVQPEKPVAQPPATQQTDGQEKQPFYPFPINPQPSKAEPSASKAPRVEPPSLYPENPEKPLTEQPVPLKHPVPEEPWGQIYQPFYPYPFLPQGPYQRPVPTHQTPTPAPKGQFQHPLSPMQPAVTKPKDLSHSKPALPAPDTKKQPPPEAPQGQVYQPFFPSPNYPYPFYPQTEPESNPDTKPPVVPKPPQPEAPRGQVYQSFYPNPLYNYPFYPHPELENQPVTKSPAFPRPPQPEAPGGQPFYPEPDNQPATKPTAVPKPSQPEAPHGQVFQPFYSYPLNPYPFYSEPEPENQPATKSPAVPKPPQPETPKGQVYQPFYPEPENQPATKPTAVPKPSQTPQPEALQGQVNQPFYSYPVYPYPFYSEPEPENQPATKPPAVLKPDVPKGQVYHPFYPEPETENQPATKPPAVLKPDAPKGQVYHPFYPEPETENQIATEPTAVLKPPQPEVPQGQVYQPFYPEPENQPATKPTAVPKPSQPLQPEAPQGQVNHPFYSYPVYPYPFYSEPEPENQPVTNPPAVLKPEGPQGQVYQPLYPYPFYPNSMYPQQGLKNHQAEKTTTVPNPPEVETPKVHHPSYPQPFKKPGVGTNGNEALTEKPVQSGHPPALKPPEGMVPYPFNPYYYPQQPQPATLPPTTSMQQPKQVTTPAKGENALDTAIPLPSKSEVPRDPQQHTLYNSPLYCPKSCPSGFSNCCLQIAFHQHLHHIVPAGPSSRAASPFYPGLPFLPSAYSGLGNGFGSTPYLPKPTEAATTTTSAPISPQSIPSGNEKQLYLKPPDGNPAALPGSYPSKPSNPELMYHYIEPNSLYPIWPYAPQNEELQNLPQRQSPAQYSVPSLINLRQLQQHTKQQDKPTAKELQSSNTKSNEPKEPTHPPPVHYYMLQDAQAPTHNKLAVNNNSRQQQPSVSGSKKSTRHEQTTDAYSGPKSYVLLQHGPPGREPNNFSEFPLPFRGLVHDANFLAHNLAKHDIKTQHPQDLKLREGKTQHNKSLAKGMANPLSGHVNMSKPGEKLEILPLHFSALDGPHFLPLPQDRAFSEEHLKPKMFNSFKDFWKPLRNIGSSQRIQPHVHGKAFQQWSSQTDHQAKGLDIHLQRRGGNRKRK